MAKITDLTNTTWYVPSGWSAPGDYGFYSLSFDTSIGTGYLGLGVGYFDEEPYENRISFHHESNMASPYESVSNTQEFWLSIHGGRDVNSANLINWLETYGIQLKVTDLTDTTWNIPAGWEAEAGYGRFSLTGTLDNSEWDITNMYIGYADTPSSDTADDCITFVPYVNIPSHYDLVLAITGGTDATNPKLIAWFSKYGELQGGEEPATVTISYNDTVIASLKAGQSATVECANKLMEDSVTISVPDGFGKGETVETWDGSFTISGGGYKVTYHNGLMIDTYGHAFGVSFDGGNTWVDYTENNNPVHNSIISENAKQIKCRVKGLDNAKVNITTSEGKTTIIATSKDDWTYSENIILSEDITIGFSFDMTSGD